MYLTFLVHGEYLVLDVLTGAYFGLTCAVHSSFSLLL